MNSVDKTSLSGALNLVGLREREDGLAFLEQIGKEAHGKVGVDVGSGEAIREAVIQAGRDAEMDRAVGVPIEVKEGGELADREGVSKAAVAIAWILRHPAKMQAIIGTMDPEHIKDACAAADVKLSHNDWYRLYLASGKFLP